MDIKKLNILKYFNIKLNKKEKDVKKLIVEASSVMDQFRQRQYYSTEYTTSDLYTALDYPTVITYNDYLQKYRRQGIATRIVKAPVDGTWADDPNVYETDEFDTNFEKDWAELDTKLGVYKTFRKLDLLASLGRFALLFLGFDDNTDPAIAVSKASELTYIKPIAENRVTIKTTDPDQKSPRFGLPMTYQIITDPELNTSETLTVHWSRVIHVAENTLESDIYGIPSLEPVYNNLLGLEKIVGGSAEGYWRGARPGYTAQAADNTIITDDQLDRLKSQLSAFVNNMQRWLYVEGMNISALAPQVVSPEDHANVQLKLISSATRIPLRILVGSERGELSSTQDERSWLAYLEERRKTVAEDLIIRPFIDRLISLSVLSSPANEEYFVEWDPLIVLSEKERSEIAKNKAQALASYVNAIGATEILPPEEFLKELGKTEAEIEKILSITEDQIHEEDQERISTDEDKLEEEV